MVDSSTKLSQASHHDTYPPPLNPNRRAHDLETCLSACGQLYHSLRHNSPLNTTKLDPVSNPSGS